MNKTSLHSVKDALILCTLYATVSLVFLGPGIKRSFFHSQIEAKTSLISESSEKKEIYGLPTHLQVPSVDIDIEVASGEFNEEGWTLSSQKAFYAKNTELANTAQGNTLIYGHHTKPVFLGTDQIFLGDEALVTTENGYTFVYKYSYSETVSPTDTSIFSYQGSPQLTLLTCKGLFNGKRRLLYFTFEKVIKNEL